MITLLVALWFLGRDLEYHMGSRALLKLYAWSAVAAAVSYLALSFFLKDYSPLIGSEAVFLSLLVAYATLWPDRPLMFEVTAKWWAVIFIGITCWYLMMTRSAVYLGHLGGVLAGYAFVKGAGFSPPPLWLENMSASFRRLRPRRRQPQIQARKAAEQPATAQELDTEEFISKEVDPILDKISQHGMHSLTPRERRILEKARQRMEKKSR
jgi:hypothetical protein